MWVIYRVRYVVVPCAGMACWAAASEATAAERGIGEKLQALRDGNVVADWST